MNNKDDCYAIDFGTSNSLLSFVPVNGNPRLIPLERNGDVILKSLVFTPEKDNWYFGQEAIFQYGEYAGDGRFFRSVKKFLPEAGFRGTEVFGRKLSIEKLIATFLREMKDRADKEIGKDVRRVLLGRPAKYSLIPENDKLAEDRMRGAAELAGFK
jgi:hypothetical chaperone protein